MTTKLRDVAGVCRFCGCSDYDPCPTGCAWADRGCRICTECAPASKAEGHALRTLRRVGYRVLDPWRAAFHRGFIVGWFAVTPRSEYGRNPYLKRKDRPGMERRHAWTLGHNHGTEARRQYVHTFGPIGARPRRTVLKPGGPDDSGRSVRLAERRDRRGGGAGGRRPAPRPTSAAAGCPRDV